HILAGRQRAVRLVDIVQAVLSRDQRVQLQLAAEVQVDEAPEVIQRTRRTVAGARQPFFVTIQINRLNRYAFTRRRRANDDTRSAWRKRIPPPCTTTRPARRRRT